MMRFILSQLRRISKRGVFLSNPPAGVRSAAAGRGRAEMERRFKALEGQHARHVDKLQNPPPHLLLVVDELATVTLGVEGKENILRLERLAQLGRSAGIHLILASQRPSIDVCPGTLKTNVPARLALATMQDSRVILDQNGAEELTLPGQAILVRGMETVKVMTPYLPDEERAQRLNALRSGEIELTNNEKLVLEAANRLVQGGKKVTQRAVAELVRGNMPKNTAENVLRNLRKHGLLAEMSNAEEEG
jgi:DNA segregation ATPase FtsK/SpoIIIE-like protein